ncbi:hypothetical protein BCAR13_440062 [Paraburkholderia caribensis]|nr:hypothetical protein BCAR13_440062 [Paraburkholderia caribensis]
MISTFCSLNRGFFLSFSYDMIEPSEIDPDAFPVSDQADICQFMEIDNICISLFDRWCEAREVVPLAYLMHNWPMPLNSLFLLRRLCRGLAELLKYHREQLAMEDRLLLDITIKKISAVCTYIN